MHKAKLMVEIRDIDLNKLATNCHAFVYYQQWNVQTVFRVTGLCRNTKLLEKNTISEQTKIIINRNDISLRH